MMRYRKIVEEEVNKESNVIFDLSELGFDYDNKYPIGDGITLTYDSYLDGYYSDARDFVYYDEAKEILINELGIDPDDNDTIDDVISHAAAQMGVNADINDFGEYFQKTINKEFGEVTWIDNTGKECDFWSASSVKVPAKNIIKDSDELADVISYEIGDASDVLSDQFVYDLQEGVITGDYTNPEGTQELINNYRNEEGYDPGETAYFDEFDEGYIASAIRLDAGTGDIIGWGNTSIFNESVLEYNKLIDTEWFSRYNTSLPDEKHLKEYLQSSIDTLE